MKLKDKIAIVTGGAKGIGFGCAKVFDQHGATVIIADKDEQGGADAAKQLSNGHFRKCDVTDEAMMKSVIDGVAAEFGRLDGIVNNAGWHPPALSIDETSTELFEAQLRLNLTSTFMGCKYAVPHLRKTGGNIVIIASEVAVIGQADACAYAASKCGQLGLMRALAIDLVPQGGRVNAICPSNVDTPLMREWAATLPDPEMGVDMACSTQPAGRMASIEEMGEIAAFLASDEASFVNGNTMIADHGAMLGYGVKRVTGD